MYMKIQLQKVPIRAVCQSEYCADMTANKHEPLIVNQNRAVLYSSNKNAAVTATVQ